MSDVVIKVENLGKLYQLGQYVNVQALRASLTNVLYAPFRRSRSTAADSKTQNTDSEHIWALKDISFEVKRGEVMGVIGRNGAGKTTLLRVLTRITDPTEGYAEIHGRVSSLLEVGTGFHQELSGRENVYMNGAILGMRKREIDGKFDEIVEFSGVEKFIDTPVKRYSSGMRVRLAFAVAAHLEPDVLLVDEVLAVGDIAFQQKCLGKMDEMGRGGRTILFVSHDMGRIGKLCQIGLLLEEGKVAFSGDVDEAITRYLQETTHVNQPELFFPSDKTKIMCIRAIRVLDHEGNPTTVLDGTQPFRVEITYEVNQRIVGAQVLAVFTGADGIVRIWNTRDVLAVPGEIFDRKPGLYASTVEFPGGILNSGPYRVGISLVKRGTPTFDSGETSHFEIVNYAHLADSEITMTSTDRSLLAIPPKWTIEVREVV